MDYLYEPSILIWVVGILGILVGSFLNVVIHRLPIMMEASFKQECQTYFPEAIQTATSAKYTLVVPRSACPHCGHQIKASENIPVISWLFLQGKCSNCQSAISIRYPTVELATAILSALLAWKFGPSLQLLCALPFAWALIALIMIDADTYLLPDSITLPLVWAGLLANSFALFTSLPSAVYGAALGYLSLWSIYWLFKLVTGKEGMGYGDFKLLAALGAWLGASSLPAIILLSSLAGAVIGIVMVIGKNRGWNKPLPFGPYLGIAGILALFFGPELNHLLYGL
ncbi:prepilin peptidase [Chitinibacter tainanensis]|uniref:prepilin peptidase n=1 Tax=Chitinibacter tainanensis TaxID=230667 RepID=UPI000423EA54|nr:A24 family peptidase [Chitinibacter tainanensis]